MHNKKFIISGKTVDNKLVIKNSFAYVDTYGINLTDLLIFYKNNNLMIDWIEFLNCASKSNWNKKSTLERIRNSCFEAYGKDFTNEVMKRLEYGDIL